MRRAVLFLKYPEPGRVKTRLAEAVGPERAARLARRFAERTLAAVDDLGLEAGICFTPPEREADLRAWLGPGRTCFAQRGADLGERMEAAFLDAFARGAERVVLTGTDAPDRPPELLAEALERLDDHDAAIGPATDGGYTLLAMRRESFTPEAFRGMDWGSSAVLAQTLDALRRAGRSVWVLPPWPDIDDEAALREYLERCPEDGRLLEDEYGC